jgi:uncharacterized glyoxalase superfamily protein PhnB
MAELNRIAQLDAAIDALLARPAATPGEAAAAHPEVAALVRLATGLRELPNPGFRERLASDLQRRAEMASTASAPSLLPPIAPYLAVHDAKAAIEFYSKAFGAVEVGRLNLPDGRIAHAEILIGGATLMLADEMPEYGFLSPQTIGGVPLKLHHYCSDVDAVVARAVAAGARLTRPIQDEFYGNREGQVADPFGYTWIVSTHKQDLTWEEVHRRFRDLMQQQAAATAPEKEPAPARKGIRTVTPYLVVERHEEFVTFLTHAFNAKETFRAPGSAGGTHLELRIGDTKIMAGGPSAPHPVALHVYVPDADAVYRRALAAGATSFYEPMDQPYGDREAGIRDGFGHSWYIATHKATGHKPTGTRSVTPTLHPRGADALMDFMKRALAAEELDCTRMPDGTVAHAQLRVGESVVELGEARGPIEPTSAMLLLEVDNVDAWHSRAVQAGGTSIEAPADQPYGARRAAVKDAHGNSWYFSAPLPAGAQTAEQRRADSPAKETRATVIPTMRYKDAPAAIEWLCRVFGFEEHLVVPNPDGTIAHAQLSFGNGMIMLGSARPDEYGRLLAQPAEIGGRETQTPYVIVSDPDAIYARAKASGAEIVTDIHDADYGGRFFSCRDLEGHHWNFGSFDPWTPTQ